MKATARTLTVAATMLAAACGAREAGTNGDLTGAQPAPANAVVLGVENHNWSDVVVYAVRNGVRHRLGSVTSMQRAVFTLPPSLVAGSGEIRLLVDPIGSRNTFLTAPILMLPGNRVEFSVENHLPLSSWSVRP